MVNYFSKQEWYYRSVLSDPGPGILKSHSSLSTGMRRSTIFFLVLTIIGTVVLAGCTQSPPSAPSTTMPTVTSTPTAPAPNQTMIDSTTEQFLGTLVPVLQDRLDTADAEVWATGEILTGTGITGPGADEALLSLSESNDWIVDAVTVAPDGTIAAVMPEQYQGVIGEYIGNQSHIVAILIDQAPALSPIFQTVEGFEAAAIAYPAYSPRGDLIGGISVPFRPDLLAGPIIIDATSGTGYGVDVLQATDGLVLYDTDPAQIGKTPDDPIYADYPELQAVMQLEISQRSGTGIYHFPTPGSSQPVEKEAAWDTISLHGTEWRVVVQSVIG
jgi:hypothetical protein